MATSQYVTFGTGAGANTYSYSVYNSSPQRLPGYGPGLADAQHVNTVLRQVSVAASGVAKFATDNGSVDALDDGSASNFAAALASGVLGYLASTSGDGVPVVNGAAARGTSNHFARADHVHPTDTSRASTSDLAAAVAPLAPIASPTFTGVPAAPTAAPGTNTTQLASTAFVAAAIGAIAGISGGLTANNQIVLPTGHILKWGVYYAGDPAGVQDYALTFPVAFPNACWAVFPSILDATGNGDMWISYKSMSAAGFTWVVNENGSTVQDITLAYLAIGY